MINNKNEITSTYIMQNGKKVGYITLRVKLVTYVIDLHIFGVSGPVQTETTNDYYLALHKFTILKNKYSY